MFSCLFSGAFAPAPQSKCPVKFHSKAYPRPFEGILRLSVARIVSYFYVPVARILTGEMKKITGRRQAGGTGHEGGCWQGAGGPQGGAAGKGLRAHKEECRWKVAGVPARDFIGRWAGPGHPGHPGHPRHGKCSARSTAHALANCRRKALPMHRQVPCAKRLPIRRKIAGAKHDQCAVLGVLGVPGVLARHWSREAAKRLPRPPVRAFPPFPMHR